VTYSRKGRWDPTITTKRFLESEERKDGTKKGGGEERSETDRYTFFEFCEKVGFVV